MTSRLALLLGGLLACSAAAAQVHEYHLDNGLKLLVKEDHRAPVVVSQVWYRVGASFEPDGLTGISHVLEHLMFKGTEAHPNGEFSRIIAENGGRENAFTSRDYTGYYQQLERSRLPVSFELEADRMRGLTFSDEEFEREVKVVMEERRLRTEDKPESLTYEHFNAAAWLASPYRRPIIGWMGDLEQLTAAEVRDWYRRWYAPNNATVVVVGDVDPESVLALAKRYFGPLKPEAVAAVKPRREPEPRGPRRIRVQAPAKLPYLLMGYPVPTLATAGREGSAPWEPYALEVLAGILDGGDSARLARRLVRESEVAASAGAGYSLYARLDDLLLLDGVPARGREPAEVERALLAEVARLRDEPVSEAELARIKAQVVAGDVYERDSLHYQANLLGRLETIGVGWRAADEYVERIRAVTAEQIQAVARKYLTEERRTIAVLEPLDGDH